MESTNRKRTLLVAVAIILLCLTIVVGVTWALFTDMRKVSNHLKAGDLSITLKRTELTKTTLNNLGYLTEMPKDTTVVNFTETTNANVFGITQNEKIVPGTKYVAKMQLENNSDVAFGYWIEIVCTDKASGAALAKQLKVTVNTGSSTSAFINDGLTVKGANGGCVGNLSIGSKTTFTVTVEFIDAGYSIVNGVLSSANNSAKGENLAFDLVVHAIQAT